MGVLGMRMRAATERVAGRLKRVIGNATDDPGLVASGTATEAGGTLKGGFAKTLGWTRGALQAGVGGVLRGVGRVTRSRDLQAVGVVKGVEGETRKAAN